MKIVILGNYATYFIPRLVAFSNLLKANGHELIVVQESDKSRLYKGIVQLETSQLNYLHLSEIVKQSCSYKKKIFGALDFLNPDVLITGFVAFPYGALGLQWAKARRKGIIEFDDQRWDTFPRGKISTWIKYRIIRHVDAFLCPAPAWDETLHRWGFRDKEIFYGLDTSDNVFWQEKPIEYSFQNLPDTYFMTLGRQTKMKNLVFFLCAYKKYLQQGGKIPLIMVGEGPEHEKLKEIAAGNEKIFFLPFQDRNHIRQLFSKMKSLILPSTKVETWGMVVNESMASGSIVAVSNECGSSTTLVKDGKNGFLFSPHDSQGIVSVLFKIEKLSVEEEQKMRNKSLEIINDWGLDRFSGSLFEACKYVYSHRKKVKNPIDYLLINLWKGRFNIKDATI